MMVMPPPQERENWLCFHCGANFTNVADAEMHFGKNQTQSPACVIARICFQGHP